jgi:hypothetical protein
MDRSGPPTSRSTALSAERHRHLSARVRLHQLPTRSKFRRTVNLAHFSYHRAIVSAAAPEPTPLLVSSLVAPEIYLAGPKYVRPHSESAAAPEGV